MAATWVYHTGQAVTLPTGYYKRPEGDIAPLYTTRNNERMPNYHRMDIGFNYHTVDKKDRSVTWSIGAYNAYSHQNPYYLSYQVKPIYEDLNVFSPKIIGQTNSIKQFSLFPILPYLTYAVKLK